VERPAGEQFIEDSTQRINIGAQVSGGCAARELFGAHVRGGAEKGVLTGVHRAVGGFAEYAGDAKVEHFGPSVVPDEYVRGLEVAVDNPVQMGVLHRIADEKKQVKFNLDIQARFRGIVGDGLTADEFKGAEIARAFVGRKGPGIKELADAGMIEQCEGTDLAPEPSRRVGGTVAGAEYFDRDGPLLALDAGLEGFINIGDAAATDEATDAVATDHGAAGKAEWGIVGVSIDSGQWGFEESRHAILKIEHRSHSTRQMFGDSGRDSQGGVAVGGA